MSCYFQADLCKPSSVHICDGSEEEAEMLANVLIDNGTFKKLPKYENWWVYLKFWFIRLWSKETSKKYIRTRGGVILQNKILKEWNARNLLQIF